jgi:non-ribosomal peptide synthetase component F
MIAYGGLTNYLRYLCAEFLLGPDDAVLPLAAIGFDAQVREIVGTLAMGARVVLLPARSSRNPPTVIRELRRHRVTALFGVVPTMLDALAAAAETNGRPDIRLVLLSGEALSATSSGCAGSGSSRVRWVDGETASRLRSASTSTMSQEHTERPSLLPKATRYVIYSPRSM